MSVKTGKRPLRSLTAHEKLDAIRRVHDGESKASVARDIGVPESTLRGWCKNEDKISYLSRQSSPDTDESLTDHSVIKRPKIEDQPFNLSLKANGHSPTSGVDLSSKPAEPDTSMKTPPATTDTPKSTCHMSERERNRAELARLSVELGLNRPEMFVPNVNNASSNLADLTANIGLLAQWNSLLMQKSLQQQSKTKVTAPADTSTSIPAGGGLLTTVDKQKDMLQHLPKDKQSVNESVWYWLKTQQSMMNLNQTPSTLSTLQNSNGISSSTPTNTNTVSSTQFPGSMTADQSSWFWKWYKQFAYGQQLPQDTKPILYQQLTKEPKAATPPPPPKQPTPPVQLQPLLQTVPVPDQQNAENLSIQDEKLKQTEKSNNNKVRSVLDNLLFNNNNNVAVNRKETRDEEEELSQSEAVEHGEKFLQWLETCSDPSVTAMQIMQFRTLLNNVKSGADRKNGDLQNKTKVKRK